MSDGQKPLHLIKLCVGVDTVEELQHWQAEYLANKKATSAACGQPPEIWHTTRMMPKRREQILAGGSLYWVIRGVIQVRQRLTDLRPVKDEDGIGRCRLVHDCELVLTEPHPRRPFQGWRYLTAQDAPPDFRGPPETAAQHAAIKKRLASLGLI